jgi:phenylalanyl-tRNA synthetase beta chain
MAAIVRASSLIKQVAGGRQASEIADVKNIDDKPVILKVEADFINRRLGLDLTSKQMGKLLENVEFKAETNAGSLKITVPFWRTDIGIPEDVVEEIGRLYGYDKLPLKLPQRDLTPAQPNDTLDYKSRLRDILRVAGANEVLTYSFVHGNLLRKAGQNPDQAYQIDNALSPDLQYYRLSITPSLIEKVNHNLRAGFTEFTIYELGKAHSKLERDKDGLPLEFDRFAMTLAISEKSPKKIAGAAYFEAKKYAEHIFRALDLTAEYRPIPEASFKNHELSRQMVAPFEPQRSAGIFFDNKLVGVVGEYRQAVSQSFKLPKFSAGLEIFLSALAQPQQTNYKPLNRFPELEQDFCLRHSSSQNYQMLRDFMVTNLAELSKPHGYKLSISPLDIYQPDGQKEITQTTWRIILWHAERTLTTEETNKLLDDLASRAKQSLRAERI